MRYLTMHSFVLWRICHVAVTCRRRNWPKKWLVWREVSVDKNQQTISANFYRSCVINLTEVLVSTITYNIKSAVMWRQGIITSTKVEVIWCVMWLVMDDSRNRNRKSRFFSENLKKSKSGFFSAICCRFCPMLDVGIHALIDDLNNCFRRFPLN